MKDHPSVRPALEPFETLHLKLVPYINPSLKMHPSPFFFSLLKGISSKSITDLIYRNGTKTNRQKNRPTFLVDLWPNCLKKKFFKSYLWKLQKHSLDLEYCHFFVRQSLSQWHHEVGHHVWHKCPLCRDSSFFCPWYVKSEQMWQYLEDLKFAAKNPNKTKSTSVAYIFLEQPYKACKQKYLHIFWPAGIFVIWTCLLPLIHYE